jgi:demethylmenaquinone methyltransferase/2-methoxy-6-polyprenyl-1,4-benzoquinol methylase
MPESVQVNSMFASIAGRYDLANRALSLGIDNLWRRILVRKVAACNPASVADLATGSGDVAIALRNYLPPTTSVEGLDFCEPMLAQARSKASHAGISIDTLQFRTGDCLDLPLEDSSVDCLTISFGLRNFEDRPKGLREMLRVLSAGGSLHILEFTQPDAWFRPFYYLYLKAILPTAARLLTGNRTAYQYLGDTIEAFPSRVSLAEEIRTAGFARVGHVGLTFGIVAIHSAFKAP